MKFDLTDEDIGLLQSAVESMRAASSSVEERVRQIDARWRIASRIEALNKRIEAARRANEA
jgi:hypothetical protein